VNRLWKIMKEGGGGDGYKSSMQEREKGILLVGISQLRDPSGEGLRDYKDEDEYRVGISKCSSGAKSGGGKNTIKPKRVS